MREDVMRTDQILMSEEVRRSYADSALGIREDRCDATGGLYTEGMTSTIIRATKPSM